MGVRDCENSTTENVTSASPSVVKTDTGDMDCFCGESPEFFRREKGVTVYYCHRCLPKGRVLRSR